MMLVLVVKFGDFIPPPKNWSIFFSLSLSLPLFVPFCFIGEPTKVRILLINNLEVVNFFNSSVPLLLALISAKSTSNLAISLRKSLSFGVPILSPFLLVTFKSLSLSLPESVLVTPIMFCILISDKKAP